MGDGIIRLFQLSLRLYEAKDGFLFIDEFENGLHFGVQNRLGKLFLSCQNL
ncbi:AAA domain protein [Acinetobacter sp. 1564232]|jgi:AAA15 family ATPase/GTPase|nr:AAA domain protein [Acinetobacter sp. 1564232]